MIIDVSEHNGTVNWDRADLVTTIAIIRLGYRGYGKAGSLVLDRQYQKNRSECERLGIPFSLYFFPQAITDAEAVAEAEFVEKEAKTMKSFVLPVFLDSESAEPHGNGRADGLDRAKRTRMLKITAEHMEKAGIPAGIYASTSWLQNRLDMSQLNYPVWVAQYSNFCTYTGSKILWQYTSKGKIPGITGGVDLSKSMADWSWKAKKTKKEKKVDTYTEKGYTLHDVKFGDRGEVVRFMQQLLTAKGFKCAEDGIAGKETMNAVAEYQASIRRTVCGHGTWKELLK